jgi:hypothetical protein
MTTFKIKVGKYYRRRDGKMEGPMEKYDSPVYPFKGPRYGLTYATNGCQFRYRLSPADLVAGWKDDAAPTLPPFDMTNPYYTPFGTLDMAYGPGTAEKLQQCGGPWDFYWDITGGWAKEEHPLWRDQIIYRKRPTPPKPREYWAFGTILYGSEAEAIEARQTQANVFGPRNLKRPIIRLIEAPEPTGEAHQ